MRLLAGDVACWLVKTAAPPAAAVPGWAPGEQVAVRRCVRRSYRLDLMAPGQRCLLWRSGREEPGVHALGVLAGGPEDDGGSLRIELLLRPLAQPVARAELLADARFVGAEVVRMPAGSNPSFLTPGQLLPVLERLGPGDPAW